VKAGVHATTLGLAVVMGVYNAAAWVRRREQHLAVDTVLYAALTEWERGNRSRIISRSVDSREVRSTSHSATRRLGNRVNDALSLSAAAPLAPFDRRTAR
jgi:hypothetical protein